MLRVRHIQVVLLVVFVGACHEEAPDVVITFPDFAIQDAGTDEEGDVPSERFSDGPFFRMAAGRTSRIIRARSLLEVSASECTARRIGSCIVGVCEAPDGGVAANPSPPPGDAGKIEVVLGPLTATLAPAANGGYPDYQASRPLWSGGETMSVSAEGGEIPAFAASVHLPAPVVVLSPETKGEALIIGPTPRDLRFSWTGGRYGYVKVDVFDILYFYPTPFVSCAFPAVDGEGVIPREAVEAFLSFPLPAGFVSTVSRKLVRRDPWPVEILAEAEATSPSGGIFFFTKFANQ